MQIDKVVNTIKSESSGFYLLESTNNESISYLEEQILNSFYEKQYEIDTSFIILEPEEKSKFITIDQVRKMKKAKGGVPRIVRKPKKTSIGRKNLSTSTMNKHKRRIKGV